MKVRLGYDLRKTEEYIELEIEKYNMKPSLEERIYGDNYPEEATIYFEGKLDSKQKRLKLEEILKKKELIFRDEEKRGIISVDVESSKIKFSDEVVSEYSIKLKERPTLADASILIAERTFAKRIKPYEDRIKKLERTLK